MEQPSDNELHMVSGELTKEQYIALGEWFSEKFNETLIKSAEIQRESALEAYELMRPVWLRAAKLHEELTQENG